MHPSVFKLAGPLNVVLFIETGLELHQGHDLFAVLGGAD